MLESHAVFHRDDDHEECVKIGFDRVADALTSEPESLTRNQVKAASQLWLPAIDCRSRHRPAILFGDLRPSPVRNLPIQRDENQMRSPDETCPGNDLGVRLFRGGVSMNVLIVTTSCSMLAPDHHTGLWLEEFAVPFTAFSEAGASIRVVSPKGGAVPIDPKTAPTEKDREKWPAATPGTHLHRAAGRGRVSYLSQSRFLSPLAIRSCTQQGLTLTPGAPHVRGPGSRPIAAAAATSESEPFAVAGAWISLSWGRR